VHLVMDNLSIHTGTVACLWLLDHPRFTFHFLPTYSPWLNLIEPWWKTLRKLALDGTHPQDVPELLLAIALATTYWNDHCHPYYWRQTA
jgi:transposase